MLTPGQIVSLSVEKPAAGGRMIARLDGQVVLVSGAIPGERVNARVERLGKGVAYAHTVGTDEASPDRRAVGADPACGGCVYAHIKYDRQLEIKSLVIADAFSRIGRLPLASRVDVRPSPEEGYRMRARLHVRGTRIGFFREGTHELCDVRGTRQLLSATCDVLERLEAGLRSLGVDSVAELDLSENLDASERVVQLDAPHIERRTLEKLSAVEGLTPAPYVSDSFAFDRAAFRLRRHVEAFFQGNRFLLGDLISHVAGLIPEAATVVDLYAGVGLFSAGSAAMRGARVTAVEGDRLAAEDLAVNVLGFGSAVRAVHQAVEAFVTGRIRDVDALIVDPPRTGMSREALDGAVRLQAARVVYVSCDVATLARDARRIVDAGYAITRADGFDLFPNTPHVETVVVFDRRQTA